MTEQELREAARTSGIRGSRLPSLEQVERRRFELWLMSTLLLLGAMCSGWPTGRSTPPRLTARAAAEPPASPP